MSTSLPELVDARLKEIGFYPVPKAVRDGIVAKLQTRMAALVREGLKDWSDVGRIAAKVDPSKAGKGAGAATKVATPQAKSGA